MFIIPFYDSWSKKEEILKRNAVSLEPRFCFFLAEQKEGPPGRANQRHGLHGKTKKFTGKQGPKSPPAGPNKKNHLIK